ncbi:MAG: hypothetical protein ACYCX8_05395, partial [Acidimicrobiales bacterium]
MHESYEITRVMRNRAGATDTAAFGPGPLSASPSPHDGSPTANRVDRETTDRMYLNLYVPKL